MKNTFEPQPVHPTLETVVFTPEELDINTYATPNNSFTTDKLPGLNATAYIPPAEDYISLEDAFGCLD